jgi:cellulose synthase (UDP-forming)
MFIAGASMIHSPPQSNTRPTQAAPSRRTLLHRALGVYGLIVASLQRRSFATKRRILWSLIALGLLSAGYYATWWMEHTILYYPILLLPLCIAIVYHGAQVLSAWFVYARIEIPDDAPPLPDRTVDVFIPVYDEPDALVAECVRAAVAMRYPHRTYLLDDDPRPERRAIAEQLGAIYLTRPTNRDAKAGNVNDALPQTDGEFVAIFDVDHIPEPHFLDRVLGHFADPCVGFVQAMVTHGNQRESIVALAAADQAYDVFSPTSMGMHGCGAATVWGAHCTFRRSALDSIGGHQTGLAEDLHTSLALHAAGWRSVYVPEVLARGLVPADLMAYVKQQLKWSRGVFAVLFEHSLPLLIRLRPAQMLCYVTRMTYYLLGLVSLINMSFTILMLFAGSAIGEINFARYLMHWLPLTLMIIAVRKTALLLWERDPQARHVGVLGLGLAFSMWPIHVLTLACAIGRVRVPHIATPKGARGGNYLPLVVPQLIAVGLLASGIAYRFQSPLDASSLAIVLFAILNILLHVPVFLGVWEGYRLARRERAAGSHFADHSLPEHA